MTCSDCQTRNPVGNKFCRECGANIVLPEGSAAAVEVARAETERAAERAAILLSDAHLLAGQGKYIGAIPVAEQAILTVPFSASAHSFLVTLYEHTAQTDKAVAAQEKVVELLPNAPKEAVRLERLKRGELTTLPPSQVVSEHNVPTLRGGTVPLPLPRWFPAAASMVAGGFALFIGYALVQPSVATKTGKLTVTAAPTPLPESSPIALNPGAMPPPAPSVTRGSDPFVPLDPSRAKPMQPVLRAAPLPRPATVSASALPLPKTLTGTRVVPTRAAPVVVPPEIVKGSLSSTGGDAPLPPINAAPPTSGDDASVGERIAAAPPRRTGYIKISVSQPRPDASAINVAPPSSSAPDMEGSPLDKARALQGMGRYTDAANAYREAIGSGAPLGESHQAIGLCYQRAGDTAKARAAYQSAVAAFRAQIASGRNPANAQRGLNSCEAALGVLGGG